MTQSPAATSIPVQLSEPEFSAFIFPHLSMPRRGPKCKLGYHRVFNLILWVLYTGMQWKCLPVPRERSAGDLVEIEHLPDDLTDLVRSFADGGAIRSAVLDDGHEASDRRFNGLTRSNRRRGQGGLGHEEPSH